MARYHMRIKMAHEGADPEQQGEVDLSAGIKHTKPVADEIPGAPGVVGFSLVEAELDTEDSQQESSESPEAQRVGQSPAVSPSPPPGEGNYKVAGPPLTNHTNSKGS